MHVSFIPYLVLFFLGLSMIVAVGILLKKLISKAAPPAAGAG